MTDKISTGTVANKVPQTASSEGEASLARKTSSHQKKAETRLTGQEIADRIKEIQADSTPLRQTRKLQPLKVPDWMKGPRPTVAEVLSRSEPDMSLPQTDAEWAELEAAFEQAEFEVYGARARTRTRAPHVEARKSEQQ